MALQGFQVFDRRTGGSKTLQPDEMTVEDVISLGLDAVNDRLPKRLLVALARMHVRSVLTTRRRREALRIERRAFGEATDFEADHLNEVILKASLAAAQEAVLNWEPLLFVPFNVPGREVVTTWGQAVVDEHAERAQWLESLSAGNLRTAVQHRAAINAIEEHHSHNLIEVVARGH